MRLVGFPSNIAKLPEGDRGFRRGYVFMATHMPAVNRHSWIRLAREMEHSEVLERRGPW